MKIKLFVYSLIPVLCILLSCTGVSQEQRDMASAQLQSEHDYCLDDYFKYPNNK